MKFLGIIFLTLCPIIVGLLKSKNLKQCEIKIEKIIDLINYIIAEIRYKKTNIYSIFKNLSFEESFKNLEFLQNFKNISNLTPFPTIWKKAITNWETPIANLEKNRLLSLSRILGSADSKEQIVALKYEKMKFEESLKNAKTLYDKQGKISKYLGCLLGIAVFIILI